MGKKKTQPTPSSSTNASTMAQEIPLPITTVQSPESVQPVKPPPFWSEYPDLWFIRLEGLMDAANMRLQLAKFNCLMQALSNEQMLKVSQALEKPRPGSEYDDLKNALLKAFGKTQSQKDSELFAVRELGEEKAVDFVNRLDRLVTDTEQLKKAFLLLVVPEDVRGIVAAQPFDDCMAMAETIDRINDVKRLNHGSPFSINAVGRFQKKGKKKEPRNPPVPDSTDTGEDNSCYYHKRFGPKARKCSPDCVWYSSFHGGEIKKSGNENISR